MTTNSHDDSLRNLLGLNESKISDTTALALGGLGVGLIGLQWLQNQEKDNSLNRIFGITSTGKILKRSRANVAASTAQYNADLDKISSGVEGGMKAMEAREKDAIDTSARARGLDAKISQASQEQYGASLSGAYATAHKALAEARASATSQLGGAMANYNMGLAEQQFKDLMQTRAERAGILGEIGGIAGSLIKNAAERESMPQPSMGEGDLAKTRIEQNIPELQAPTGIEALDTTVRVVPPLKAFTDQGLNPLQVNIPYRR